MIHVDCFCNMLHKDLDTMAKKIFKVNWTNLNFSEPGIELSNTTFNCWDIHDGEPWFHFSYSLSGEVEQLSLSWPTTSTQNSQGIRIVMWKEKEKIPQTILQRIHSSWLNKEDGPTIFHQESYSLPLEIYQRTGALFSPLLHWREDTLKGCTATPKRLWNYCGLGKGWTERCWCMFFGEDNEANLCNSKPKLDSGEEVWRQWLWNSHKEVCKFCAKEKSAADVLAEVPQKEMESHSLVLKECPWKSEGRIKDQTALSKQVSKGQILL